MLPVIIFVAVAIPILVIAFVISRRSAKAGEHPAGETDADRLELEREFAESERYQEEWRAEQHKQSHDQ